MQNEKERLKNFILSPEVFDYIIFPVIISKNSKYNKQMEAFEQSGELEKVLEDFKNAEAYFDGKLLLGRTYVFGKGSRKICAYSEIKSIYQHIQRTNFIVTDRTLMFILNSEKRLAVCDLPIRGKEKRDDELNRAVTAICQRNPNITL